MINMLEKEVKQYKRGNSFTYRIDLSKKDNFAGGEMVKILTLDEYEEFIDTINQYKNQITEKDNIISDLKDQNNNIKLDIGKEVDKRNEEIAKKNEEIKNLIDENQESLQKCYDIIDEKDKSLTQSNEEIRIERDKADKITQNAQEEIRLEREKNDRLMISKDEMVNNLNSKIEQQNNEIVAYRLLIERYKSRSFVDRLLNREPEEDLPPRVGAPKTFVLESEEDSD